AAAYRLVDDYAPSGFFDKFTFYDRYDPTYGHVKYVNRSVALTNGYAYHSTTNNSAVIKPDTINKWPPGNLPNGQFLPGRPSVRLESFNTYYHGLFIFDATHVPTGCGTWPAYWLLGPSWPANGEIGKSYIIEGVHNSETNTMSLHSSPNCSIMGSGQTGTFATSDCDSSVNGNSGCGSELRSATAHPDNYGTPFNANRGGVYATEWTSNYIKHWFFPRGQIPASIVSGNPDVSTFGVPAVNAQGACNIDSHFRNMSIIINIDFCGAWAGTVYDQWPTCPQDVPKDTSDTAINRCAAFVGEYPERMNEAYWEINRIQVFQ
ncbi:glycoside hydrolase family 16 protein, partial [Cercospora zeae-maydis SCOH1-5]